MSKYRILFFAETVTLAHLARPVALARTLDQDKFEPIVAAGPQYRELVAGETLEFRELETITSSQFLAALAHGRPIYSFETLRAYVEEDLKHIQAVRPDAIVGDFRLSLSVSARVAGVPYLTISNAYWSPYAQPHWEVPSHPSVKVLGPRIAGAGFRFVRPAVFALHSIPMHRLRRTFGLSALGFDLRRVYTDADWTLYADVPELVPIPHFPERSRHLYVGPVSWSPRVPLPAWWNRVAPDDPVVYVTMGSSGNAAALSAVLEALEPLPCVAVVATAGARSAHALPRNVHVAEYLPGDVMAGRSCLVICNGGSLTTHQALAKGVPVLGVAENLDQYLNMGYVEAFGAGRRLRADSVNANSIRLALRELMGEPRYAQRASEAARALARLDSARRIDEVLRSAVVDDEAVSFGARAAPAKPSIRDRTPERKHKPDF